MKPIIIMPVAGTIENDECRNVNPRIVGPDRSWFTYVRDDIQEIRRANPEADILVHCPWGNHSRIQNGAYCCDSWFHAERGTIGDNGKRINPYTPLSRGFEAFRKSWVGFYAPSPEHNHSERKLARCYSPMIECDPSMIVLDHATESARRNTILRVFEGIPLMVEGGSPADIALWPSEVGWFLESRSPFVWTREAQAVGRLRRVVIYAGFGSINDRISVVKQALEWGYDPAIVRNDLPEFSDAGLSIKTIAGKV